MKYSVFGVVEYWSDGVLEKWEFGIGNLELKIGKYCIKSHTNAS